MGEVAHPMSQDSTTLHETCAFVVAGLDAWTCSKPGGEPINGGGGGVPLVFLCGFPKEPGTQKGQVFPAALNPCLIH